MAIKIFDRLTYGDQKWVLVTIREGLIVRW
jgi:hypothetical protein